NNHTYNKNEVESNNNKVQQRSIFLNQSEVTNNSNKNLSNSTSTIDFNAFDPRHDIDIIQPELKSKSYEKIIYLPFDKYPKQNWKLIIFGKNDCIKNKIE